MKVLEILNAASKYKNSYKVVAVRTQEQPFNLGCTNHVSAVWKDGTETNKKLKGICATNIKSKSLIMHSEEYTCRTGYYYGDYKAIICGNNYKYGVDSGEVIILDHVVVEILQ